MANLIGLVTGSMPDTLNIFIGIFDVIIGLISIFIGILIAMRLRGKLKSAVIFLILVVGIIIIREILILANISYPTFIIGLMRVITTLLILFAMLNMKQMIDGIDNHLRKGQFSV